VKEERNVNGRWGRKEGMYRKAGKEGRKEGM
jgi:hypothetical protein